MTNNRTRIEREKKTIQCMIAIYCQGHRHTKIALCGNCGHLFQYAMKCIDECPYLETNKPVCGLCLSQCFEQAILKQFTQIMRYAGPRMLLLHPVLSIQHFFDALKARR